MFCNDQIVAYSLNKYEFKEKYCLKKNSANKLIMYPSLSTLLHFSSQEAKMDQVSNLDSAQDVVLLQLILDF